MRQKIAALFILLTLLPFNWAAAEETEKTPYLWATGVGTGIYAYTTVKGAQAFATSEDAHSGTYAMKVQSKEVGNTRIWIEAENLTPGTSYSASAWVKLTKPLEGSGVIMRVAENFKAAAGVSWATSSELKTTNGIWKKLTASFTQPESTTYATINLDSGRIPVDGAIYWDDVEISGAKIPGGDFEAVETRCIETEVLPQIPAGAESLLLNGSFEDQSDGKPEYWRNAYGGGFNKTNPYVSLSNEYACSGDYSLRLTADDTESRPWANQRVPVIPLATYIISARILCTSLTSGSAKIKFEFYNAANEDVGAFFNSKGVTAATNGEWVEIRQTFSTVADCASVVIYPRLYGAGTVYYDDVFLYLKNDAPDIDLSTNGVYYYEDETEGIATAAQVPGKDYTGCTVDFSIKDGNETPFIKKDTQFEGGEAVCTFPLSSLRDLRREYTLEAVLKRNGETVDTQSISIYRYERSPYLRKKDGVYLKNKTEPFYPVVAYHVAVKDYPKMAEAGINVVQCTFDDYLTLRNALNAAEENNIMVLAALYRNVKMPAHPDNYEVTADVLNRFKNHPALFGWMVMDEPFGNFPYNEAVEGLRESYKLIREIDREHPVYTLDNQANTFSESIKYVDILATDPYPGSKHDTANYVAERVGAAVGAADGKKPVYAILQAFEYSGFWPDADQMRSMAYQARLAGAAAVGYYAVSDARVEYNENVPLYNTELWEHLRGLAFADYPILNTVPEVIGTQDDCVYAKYTSPGRTYIAVYSKNKDAAVTVSILAGEGEVSIVSGSGACTISGGALQIELPKCGAALFELVPPGAKDSPRFYMGDMRLLKLPSGEVGVSVKCNDTPSAATARMYVVLYKKDGEKKRMERLEIVSGEISTEGDELYTLETTVPEGSYMLRAFVWAEDLVPAENLKAATLE